MSKRKSIEDIIYTEIRWPSEGDKPFVSSNDPSENTHIAEDGFIKLVLMTEGYKSAGDLMVEYAVRHESERDLLVFPIVFNYRQFLELSLKYQLATYGPTVGIEPNWSSHDLAKLWGEFLDMLGRYGTTDPDEADPIVEEIIFEFAKIDPASYSYRYPVDRQGKPLPAAIDELHLPTLGDVLEAVASYLTGCDGYLDNLKSASSGS